MTFREAYAGHYHHYHQVVTLLYPGFYPHHDDRWDMALLCLMIGTLWKRTDYAHTAHFFKP